MIKETLISITIIITIFSFNIITQKYTKKVTNNITHLLEDIETSIKDENIANIDNAVNNLENDWNSYHKKLAYYIEHDELEKVDNAIIAMKSFIKTKQYPDAIAELEEARFVLKHIQEKNSLNLENIF